MKEKKKSKKLSVKSSPKDSIEESMSNTSEDIKIKRLKIFSLNLTKLELVHLRDILSILYPTNSEKTISQALAEIENRTIEENILWNKVSSLCDSANIPIDSEAPDYVMLPVGPAPMGIFMLGQEEEQQVMQTFLKETELNDKGKE